MESIKKAGAQPLSFRAGLGLVAAFFMGLAGIYSFADQIGMRVDRWTWLSETLALEQKVAFDARALEHKISAAAEMRAERMSAAHAKRTRELERRLEAVTQIAGLSLADLLLKKKRALYEVEHAIHEYEKEGEVAPKKLTRERDLIMEEIASIERVLSAQAR